MLPAYLTFVISDTSPGRPVAVARAAAVTVAMTLGFLTVFAVFGALTIPVAAAVQRYLPLVTVVVGVVAGGGRPVAAGRLPAADADAAPPERWAPTTRLGSMFGYGVAYAVASLSCTVGPFLAVTAAGARSGSTAGAVAVYLAYAAGFALIVGTLAVAAAFACSALATRLRRLLPVVNRIGGALVILVGVYVAYYGSYELRLFTARREPARRGDRRRRAGAGHPGRLGTRTRRLRRGSCCWWCWWPGRRSGRGGCVTGWPASDVSGSPDGRRRRGAVR